MPAPLKRMSLYAHIEDLIGHSLKDVNFTNRVVKQYFTN